MTNKLNNPFKVTELINAVNELDTDKQDTLISGTNIKTINGSSILGNGDLTITADTNDCVHLTGNETINGKKIFSNDYGTFGNAIVLLSTGTNCNFPFSFQLPSYTKGNTPSSSLYCGIDFYGSKKTAYTDRIGNIEFSLNTTKLSSVSIQAYDCNSSSSTDLSSISIFYPAGGTPYTEAPTPTDTMTTSGKQIATTGWVNSTGNNVVHLSGTETISGNKTFTGDKVFVGGYANVVIKNTTNNNSDYSDIEFDKANGTRIGNIRVYNNGDCGLGMFNHVTAPASDVGGSIVTTVNKNKAQNGYFQLGNGLIIQWGYSNQYGSSKTVTFPKAFTTTNYAVTISRYANEWTEAVVMQTNNYKTTSFDFTCNDPGVHWIAIGY